MDNLYGGSVVRIASDADGKDVSPLLVLVLVMDFYNGFGAGKWVVQSFFLV